MAQLAFLGLGAMGCGMACRLASAGHQVHVWNRSADKSTRLAAHDGIEIAQSPRAAAGQAEAVFSMVTNDAASERVWLADDGALSSVSFGTLLVECSTLSHSHILKLAKTARELGASFLDCPVNGPPAAAARGELVQLVGAAPSDLDRARPYLELFSKKIYHFGEVGTGTAYKLISNQQGAVHVAAIAEAVHLAEKLKIDPQTFIQAVEEGPFASPRVKKMVRPMRENRLDENFGMAIGYWEKDIGYCLQMARENGADMAVGNTTHQWYQSAVEKLADQGEPALLKVIREFKGRI